MEVNNLITLVLITALWFQTPQTVATTSATTSPGIDINECSDNESLNQATDIRVFRHSNVSLNITWAAPSNKHCFQNVTYSVPYTLHKGKVQIKAELDASKLQYLVSDFNMTNGDITYKLKLQVKSQAGDEKESTTNMTKKCIIHVGKDLQELVGLCDLRYNISREAITVNWNQPSNASGITYSVGITLKNQSQCSNIENPYANETKNILYPNHTFISESNDWLPFSSYSIRVRAFLGGTRKIQRNITFNTLEATPGHVEIQAFSTAHNSINVQWKRPLNLGCLGTDLQYDIFYEVAEFNQCGSDYQAGAIYAVNGTKETNFTINGLRPNTTYSVTVVAKHPTAGVGRPYSLVVPTEHMVPGESPNNVTLLKATNSSLTIGWNEVPCNATNGVISHYTYNFSRYKDRKLNESSGISNSNMVTIDGLTCGKQVNFSVAGVNNAGAGNYSNLTMFTTLTRAPGIIQQLPIDESSTSLNVTWDPPLYNGCPSGILKYRVFNISVTSIERCGPKTLKTIPIPDIEWKTETQFSVPNLDPGTIYNVTGKIQARSILIGNWTNFKVTKATKEVIPSEPPDNVALLEATISSLTIGWNEVPCNATNGVISHYTYNFSRYKDRKLNESSGISKSNMVTIDGLTCGKQVNFSVAGVNNAGAGNYSNLTMFTTLTKEPSTVQNLSMFSPKPTSLSVSWAPPTFNGCPKRGTLSYHIDLIPIKRRSCVYFEEDKKTVQILDITKLKHPLIYQFDNLNPRSTYSAEVRFQNKRAGISDPIYATGKTKPKDPDHVQNLIATALSSTNISLQWQHPYDPFCYQAIVAYTVNYTMIQLSQCQKDDNKTFPTLSVQLSSNNTSCVISGLEPHSIYEFSVFSRDENGLVNVSTTTEETLDVAPVGSPTEIQVHQDLITSESITLSWFKPLCHEQGGMISKYVCSITNTANLNNNVYNISSNQSYTNQSFGGLNPFVDYKIHIAAANDIGLGPFSVAIYVTTLQSEPPPPLDVDAISGSNTSITVNWSMPYPPHGIIRNYDIRYLKTTKMKSNVLYLPWVLLNHTSAETVLNLTGLEIFTNYSIQVRAETIAGKGNWSETIYAVTKEGNVETMIHIQSSDDTSGPIVGASVVIVLLLVVMCVVFAVAWRRRQHRFKLAEPTESLEMGANKRTRAILAKTTTSTDRNQGIIKIAAVHPRQQVERVFHPILLDDLPKHIQTHKADYMYEDDDEDNEADGKMEICGFTKEFKSIPFGQTYPCSTSKLPDNVKKNRYLDIAAYDHSRVKLNILDGKPHSDYINASYLKGYKDRVYIACQGPNSLTLNDMWRMVWEQNSAKVIMLTNLIEKGKVKCQQYWPSDLNKSIIYGPVSVQKTTEEGFTDYTIRTFEIKKVNEDVPARKFKQFHYTSWPDMGVPQSPTPLLKFLKVAGSYTYKGAGPDIVHCSAGVGRTGTYIVIEAMLDMAKEEGQIDVHAMVSQLREDRIKMVQTQEQYEFIYDAVLDHVFCGDTSITVTDLRAEFASLTTRDKMTGLSQLDQQLKTLELLTEAPPPIAFKKGRLKENTDKIRYPDKIPADRSRPYLMTPGTEGSTDYINAACLDGYRFKAAYLATQMPLANTVNDIWRMVYDYKSSIIVMLNEMDKEDSTQKQYWPESGSQVYGYLEVSVESETILEDDITIRTFQLKTVDSGSSGPLIVQQIQFKGWPATHDVPTNVKLFLSLANLVRLHHKMGPITVHCMDGVERSGMFCALLSILDQIQEEKIVDVFQTVRRLRRGRPGVVETMEQYRLLYEAALTSLEEYSIYQNFNTEEDSVYENVNA